MKKTLLYIRVSTGRQVEEGFSLGEQEKRLVNYCKDNGITNYENLVEAGFTGKNIHRPKYEYAMDLIIKGEVERIVLFKLDRMFRNTRDTLAFVDDIAKPNDVILVSLHETLDTSTPQGRFMLTVYAGVAEMELGTMRIRMDAGALGRAESGLWHGGANVTYGYTYDKETDMLIPNENAEKVKQAYQLYIEGHSTTEIARLLGFKYSDRIAKILKRPTYAGYIVHNSEVFKGKHDPIISEEIYTQAQEELKRRTWNRVSKHYYLLGNITYCAYCGAKIFYFPNSRGKTYLRCYSNQNQQKYLKHSDNCPYYSKRAFELEEKLIEKLFSLNYQEHKNENETVSKGDMLQKQKISLTQKLSRLYSLWAEQENDILKTNIETLLKELADINTQIKIQKEKQEKQAGFEQTHIVINNIKTSWQYMTPQEHQQAVRALIEKVIISNDKVTVYWHPHHGIEPYEFAPPGLLRRL